MSLFIADLTIYYLLPLLLSVILYVLIGKTLLSKSRNRLPGGGTRSSSLSTTAALKANNSRVQVGTILVSANDLFKYIGTYGKTFSTVVLCVKWQTLEMEKK